MDARLLSAGVHNKMASAATLDFGKNVNSSIGLDKDICTKFYGRMHDDHAEMTT